MTLRDLRPPVSTGSDRQPRSRVLRAAAVTGCALAVLAAAAFPARAGLYLAVARTAEAAPVGRVLGAIAEKGLLVLVAVTGVLAVRTLLRDRARFWTLVTAGAGVVLAYLTSELVKIMVAEQRPCRVLDLRTVLECPAPGDWSWPSNHSVIAAAFATACVLAAPRLACLVVPVALLIGFTRVAAGVHYLHDVASGLALGTLAVTLTTAALRPVAARLTHPAPSGG